MEQNKPQTDEPNPHIKYRGDLYDPKKSDERIVEATGKSIEQIKKEFDNVFKKFEINVRKDLDILIELQQENARLKREIIELKNTLVQYGYYKDLV